MMFARAHSVVSSGITQGDSVTEIPRHGDGAPESGHTWRCSQCKSETPERFVAGRAYCSCATAMMELGAPQTQ